MSTTVTYKGNTLATISNNTKTLKTAGKYMEGDVVLTDVSQSSPTIQSLSITPSETAQTFNASGVDGYKPVTVSAISSTYVGSGITRRTSSDLTNSLPSGYYRFVVPAGYYAEQATKDIARYDLPTPTISIDNSTGIITATNYLGNAGFINTGTKTATEQLTLHDDTDLTVSGATVTAPAGYYSAAASKSVSSMTLPTAAASSATSGYISKATIYISGADQYINIPTGYNTTGSYYKIPAINYLTLPSSTASSATSGYTSKATITPSTSDQYINIGTGYNSTTSYYKISAMTTMTLPTSATSSATSGYTKKATISRSTSKQYINIAPGYNSAGGYYEISAVANGSAKGPSSLSGSSATVSTGTNTLTLTKTGVTTTPTVTAGYVSSATASTATVTLTASVTTKAAATITPTTTNQTIAAGTYLTGVQTIAGDADLIASNIKKDVNIFGVTGTYDPTDFIINLTQDSSNKWIPDCTFAEAEAALNSGKALKFVAEYPAGDAYFAGYDDLVKTIAYGVVENTSTLNGAVLIDKTFIYDVANTVTQDLTFTYYETAQATAQASDVVSTKTFFNGSGYQTGTLDLTDIYIRSAAPTSSVGSDGDIYIQE